ncbi:MAG: hypothetical protein OXG98_17505, partial [Gemmatimonadetes bacterium]|nr:hypothetical protein [Gemmatimonadota bacterium]
KSIKLSGELPALPALGETTQIGNRVYERIRYSDLFRTGLRLAGQAYTTEVKRFLVVPEQ